MNATPISTLADLRRAFPVGTRVEITNHYVKREDHPCFGTRTATVSRNTASSLWVDESRIEWPRRAQLKVSADSVTFLGGGCSQAADDPFLTLRALAT